MKDLIKRITSPVVLTVVIGGLGIALDAIDKLPVKTFLNVGAIVLGYLVTVFAALNNPTDKKNF